MSLWENLRRGRLRLLRALGVAFRALQVLGALLLLLAILGGYPPGLNPAWSPFRPAARAVLARAGLPLPPVPGAAERPPGLREWLVAKVLEPVHFVVALLLRVAAALAGVVALLAGGWLWGAVWPRTLRSEVAQLRRELRALEARVGGLRAETRGPAPPGAGP